MRSPQRKQNGYARKNNGFVPSTAASSLDSWYQEHMMSGGHSTAAWPDHAALAPAVAAPRSSSVPAYNWTRQRFERFHVEPRAGGNYALVDRLQAEQARQRALLEQGLLGPSATELVLQVRNLLVFVNIFLTLTACKSKLMCPTRSADVTRI